MHHHNTKNLAVSFCNPSKAAWPWVLALGAVLSAAAATAQTLPEATTQQVAPQAALQGVALADLAAKAPDHYVVKPGDTLWGIAGLYLQKPWRWPALWGMNRQDIANPHLIFPGQTLYLDKEGGVARLRTRRPGQTSSGALETVRVSPRTRSTSLADAALPTLQPHLIEAFLAEPLVVDAQALLDAPRMIALGEDRVLMSAGDRVYARGSASNPLSTEAGEPRQYRVFRDATPLKHPITQEILGYEAHYLGKAELLRGEGTELNTDSKGNRIEEYIPATLSISSTREEIRAGDKLLPMPERSFVNYTPKAPAQEVDARVVSIYSSTAVVNVAQNQIIAISAGEHDGLQPGDILSLMTKGQRIVDKTDPSRVTVKLPSETNGMAMVFRTFERVSYALILTVQTTVQVGDRLVNPE